MILFEKIFCENFIKFWSVSQSFLVLYNIFFNTAIADVFSPILFTNQQKCVIIILLIQKISRKEV